MSNHARPRLKVVEGEKPARRGVLPGMTLDGTYLVGALVAEEPGSLFYAAQNLELDEAVVVEAMRPELANDAAVVRFGDAAKAAASLRCEHIARVFDVGASEDGVPYVVMEHVDGKSLDEIAREAGPPVGREMVEHALQICEALAVAHARGIVHGALGQDTIRIMQRTGGMSIVKVLDFGIARALATTPIPTPGPQADIRALGAIMQRALDGRMGPGLAAVVARACDEDYARCFANVAELALALMPFGPKRCRLHVERAISVLQSSGHADPNLSVTEDSLPPTSMDPLSIEASLLHAALRPTPTLRSEDLTAGVLPDLPGSVAPEAPAAAAPLEAAPSKRLGAGVIAAIVFAVVGILAAVVAAIVARSTPEAPPVATAPSATAAAAPSLSATSVATTVSSVPVARSAPASPASPSGPRVSGPPRRPPVAAPHAPSGPPAPTPAPPAPAVTPEKVTPAPPAESAGRTFRREL